MINANKKILLISAFVIFVYLMQIASAVTITSVNVAEFAPSSEGTIGIEVKNTLNSDIEDVSLSLQLTNLPFTSVGSSEDSFDEIREDKSKEFVFRLKAASDIKPGDYQIPYILAYKDDTQIKEKKGTIGVSVIGNVTLDFTIDAENPIMGEQGVITLKVVNRGNADARFVSVKVLPQGYTILSDNEDYIGSVNSDDFETASLDVIYSKNARFNAVVTYRDFDNREITRKIELPIKVYTKNEAIKLGIAKNSNAPFIIGIVVLIFLLIILWRIIKKRRRVKKSLEAKV